MVNSVANVNLWSDPQSLTETIVLYGNNKLEVLYSLNGKMLKEICTNICDPQYSELNNAILRAYNEIKNTKDNDRIADGVNISIVVSNRFDDEAILHHYNSRDYNSLIGVKEMYEHIDMIIPKYKWKKQ